MILALLDFLTIQLASWIEYCRESRICEYDFWSAFEGKIMVILEVTCVVVEAVP